MPGKRQPKNLAEEIGKHRPFDDAETEAYLNLVRTSEHLQGMCDRFFKARGISAAQYNVLRILRGHGERMQTRQIATEMVTREPDITRLVDRLVGRKLVSRCRCPEDRRVVWVELSKAGGALLKSLDRPVAELHRLQLGHLSDAKLHELSRLLFEARHRE